MIRVLGIVFPANHLNLDTVEIEDLQTDKFARNFNTPLNDLNDPMII